MEQLDNCPLQKGLCSLLLSRGLLANLLISGILGISTLSFVAFVSPFLVECRRPSVDVDHHTSPLKCVNLLLRACRVIEVKCCAQGHKWNESQGRVGCWLVLGWGLSSKWILEPSLFEVLWHDHEWCSAIVLLVAEYLTFFLPSVKGGVGMQSCSGQGVGEKPYLGSCLYSGLQVAFMCCSASPATITD